MFWEMKAEPNDYRIRLQLVIDSSQQLMWQVQGDRLINAVPLWEYRTANPAVRLGQWHTVEICMDRPNARFWAAIDRQLIADRAGNLYGALGLRTTSVKHAIVYGEPREGEHTLDDFEIWSAPPCSNRPCGF